MIRFSCPGCNKEYNVKDDKAGKTGKCPACGTAFTIPGGDSAALVPKPRLTVRREVEEDEERPIRRRMTREDDQDDEVDDRPRRKKRRRIRARNDDGEYEDEKPFLIQYRGVFRIISGIMSLLTGAMNILCGLWTMLTGAFILSIFGAASQVPNNTPNNPAQSMFLAGGGMITGAVIGCGVCFVIFACLYIMAGVGALARKPYGRILTIIVGVFCVIQSLFMLFSVVKSLLGGNFGGFFIMSVVLVYAAIHAVLSFLACFGPGADKEFRG
jgi:ribosomal protein S27E